MKSDVRSADKTWKGKEIEEREFPWTNPVTGHNFISEILKVSGE